MALWGEMGMRFDLFVIISSMQLELLASN